MPADRADVDAILQVAQHALVEVDDGDFVRFFAGEVIRRGPANLAGPEDDYFQDLGTCKAARHSSATRRASDDLQVGVTDHQPLRALALEVDLHPRIGALAFEVQHHAVAELGVPHALAQLEAARRVVLEARPLIETRRRPAAGLWT